MSKRKKRETSEELIRVDKASREKPAIPATSSRREAYDAMLAALVRQRDNIDRWLDTGEPAGAAESESIYNEIVAAIEIGEGERCQTR